MRLELKTRTCNYYFLFIIFITSVIVIWPGLAGPLIYDDYPNLSLLLNDAPDFTHVIFGNKAGPLGRPVTMATFVVNYWFSGGLVPFELKFTNLLIHLFNGLLVFLFVKALLEIKLSADKALLFSVLVTGLWILNSYNTETVLYVIQRAALLSTFFMLISCLTYMKLRAQPNCTSFKKYLFICIIFFGWVMGMLSKENAVLLPLILICIELSFFDFLNLRHVFKNIYGIPIFLYGIILFCVFIFFLNKINYLDFTNRGFTLAERLYTQPIIVTTYLKEVLIPQGVNVGLYRDNFEIKSTFFNITTVCCFLFLAGLLIIGIINLGNKKYKYISAGILIFFTGHLLESTIFPLELYFKHRNYFPILGIFLSLVLFMERYIRTKKTRRIVSILFSLYLGVFAFHTYSQSKVWSSYQQILMNGYKNHPESLGVNLELVGQLVYQKNLLLSLETNSKIIALHPEKSLPAKIQRLYIYCTLAKNMPSNEYGLFEQNINLTNILLVSSALQNFLFSFQSHQCGFIDMKRIIDSLTRWVDEQIIIGQQSILNLWTIDYYMIELLLLLNQDDAAKTRLNLHIQNGNHKAAYYKENVLPNRILP